MPLRVKWYLIFWVILIIIVLLATFSKKFHRYLYWRQQTGKKMMVLRYYIRSWLFGDIPEEKPNYEFKNIIKKFFILLILFFIGLAIVYYNFLGVSDIFVCKRHDLDCKINAIKNSIGAKNNKQSKSGRQKISTSKVVKKNNRR